MPLQLSPEMLNDFRAYGGDGLAYLGLVSAELPNIEAMTTTISGSGIAGEYEQPQTGRTGSMTATLTWRAATAQALSLLRPIPQNIQLLASVQMSTPALPALAPSPVAAIATSSQLKIIMRGQAKNVSLGSMTPGDVMGTTTEFELTAISIFVDGVPRVIIDKINGIYIIDNVDYMAKTRSDTGL